MWLTVDKAELEGRRKEYEDRVLVRLKEVMPEGVAVTVVADRGFGDHKLYELLASELGFGFVIRFRGMTRVSDPARRDRVWLLNALAMVLLTLAGAAGESPGHDRMLKANTVKTRTHSLFRQGSMLQDLIPTMPEGRLLPLVERFSELLSGEKTFTAIFGTV